MADLPRTVAEVAESMKFKIERGTNKETTIGIDRRRNTIGSTIGQGNTIKKRKEKKDREIKRSTQDLL